MEAKLDGWLCFEVTGGRGPIPVYVNGLDLDL